MPQNPTSSLWFLHSHFSCFLLHDIFFRAESEGGLHPSYWSSNSSTSPQICWVASDSNQPTIWLEEARTGSQRLEVSALYLDIWYCNKRFSETGGQTSGILYSQCDIFFKYFEYWYDMMKADTKFLYLSMGGHIWGRELNLTHRSSSWTQLI